VSSRFLGIFTNPSLETPQPVLVSFAYNGTAHNPPCSGCLGRFPPRRIRRHVGQAAIRHLTVASKPRRVGLLPIHPRRRMSRMITRHFYLVTFVLYTSSRPSRINYSLSDPDEVVARVSRVSSHPVSSFAPFPLPFYTTIDPSPDTPETLAKRFPSADILPAYPPIYSNSDRTGHDQL